MLDEGISRFEPNADEVVKVPIWKALDVQINRRALNVQFRIAGDVDLALPNG
jgi:hypothetical protein